MSDPSLVSSRTQPGYHAHALESLVEMASFLSLRFPKLFTVERTSYVRSDPSSHGDSTAGKEAGAIRVIHNHVTGEVWDLEVVERAEGPEWDPMRVAGRKPSFPFLSASEVPRLTSPLSRAARPRAG